MSATTYVYNATGAVWSFAGSSGIQSNGSSCNAASAPNGTQTAFLQGISGSNGAISQSFNWSAGARTVSFTSSQRGTNTQSIKVYVDSTLVVTVTPGSSSFTTYTTPSFNVTAGSHTLKFEGGSTSGDNTVFIDQVSVG